MVMITEPGIYDMPADVYHRSPTPEPSLSSSGAYTLASECPAAYRFQSRNPVNKRVFDLGTASHLMMLEPALFDDTVVVIRGFTADGKPSKGYQSAAARDQRDAAYVQGKVPLLPEEAEMIRGMHAALWADPIGKHAFRRGKPEQSIFWRDAEFGIWRRTRPDWVPDHGNYLVNYKSAASSNPDDVAKAIFNLGYFAKSAWELDGFEAVTGARPKKFCLLVQSKQPPYLVVPVWLHPDDMAWGQKLNRYACGVFRWCLDHDEWPGYSQPPGQAPRGFEDIRMPVWAIKQLEARELAGGFAVPQEMGVAA
jgi:hypothetical protein